MQSLAFGQYFRHIFVQKCNSAHYYLYMQAHNQSHTTQRTKASRNVLGSSSKDMDQITFTSWLHPSDFSFLLLLSSFLLALHLIFIQRKGFASSPSSKRHSLPPGPKPWPIIGNILHLGNKPHISLANFAKVHGPLISLRLGTQLLVVGSSSRAATEILKAHDRSLAGRKVPKSIPRETRVLDRMSIVWASECNNNQYWKSFRALCKNALFSAKALDSQVILREKKVADMVEFLSSKEGKVVNIGEAVFATVFNTLGNLLFSREFIGFEEEGGASGLKNLIWRIMVLVAAPNFADFYSILAGMDPQGLKRQMIDCLEEVFAIWEVYIKERRETPVNSAPKGDFLDTFLVNGLDNDQINWLVLELFAAGTDTITTTVEWTMAELLKNKEVMKKVCKELKKEINRNSIKEFHVFQLLYLNACIKETLRLHPPAPFLIPRCAAETCQILDYTVPKNSRVLVNVWALGRDPSIWEDPLLFKPERFLRTSSNSNSRDLELLAFGGGRRMCPGMPMAVRQLPLILASLLYHFDWSLPNGEDPFNLDMNDKFGITLQKEEPVLLLPRRIT